MPMDNRFLVPRSKFNPLTPSTIEDLELWLDASESSTLTLNATTVSEWRDRRSGSNRKAVQATALNQPDYEASVIGGKPGVYFKANSWMDTTGDVMGFAQPVSYFCVLQSSPTGHNKTLCDTNGSGRHIFLVDSSTRKMRVYAGAFVNIFEGEISGSQDSVIAVVINGGSSEAARNGGALEAISNPGALTSNSQIKLGAFANNTSSLEGRVSEFHVYSSALKAADVASLMAYARIKWGVA